MKYKVGDEVLAKCKIINVHPDSTVPYEVARTRCNSGFAKPLYIIVGDEDIENMSAEEAWEIATKISLMPSHGGLEYSDLQDIFGTSDAAKIMKNNTPQEAKDKIEAWEAENEIKVGDVVIETSEAGNEYIGVVTQITSAQNSVCIVYTDGSTNITLAKNLKKTGRHIDIDAILRQIGGNDA